MVIVSGKRAEEYNRIKKNLDCRFGVASQVMQAAHVRRAQTQYIGNVLMKVNAKLGGFSFKSIPNPSHAGKPFTHFKVPTMIIGADVTHPAAGVMSLASMASMTVSMDKFGMKYVAGCESNGHRLEMIQTWTWYEMALPLFRDWMSNVGGGNMPHHVIYLRDGVSESQHQHILQQEVRDIRAVWNDIDSNPKKTQSTAIKYTVAIASKRHHIRFFPPGGTGDRTGNCMPGTLVEHDCTSPTDWDFFLCAHSAIKGTARPAHYHVLLHEAPVSPTDFIQMLYAHSYQYVRSSTPVSQHPAIYYAHLAARRSIAHERQENNARKHKPSEARELIELLRAHEVCNKTGKIMTKTAVARLKELTEIEYPSLLPMVTEGGLHRFMWYV